MSLEIKEWSHLRHLLLLQLAGPGPRQLAGPTGGDGIGSLHLPGSGECTAGNRIRNVIFIYMICMHNSVTAVAAVFAVVSLKSEEIFSDLHLINLKVINIGQVSQYLYLNTASVYIAAILLGFGGPVLWTAQVVFIIFLKS